MRKLLLLLALIGLTACTGRYDDLEKWIAAQNQDVKERVEPMPPIRQHIPFTYSADDLLDPFVLQKITAARAGSDPNQPDLSRKRDPLEAYQLQELKMVGSLRRGNALHALVRTPENQIILVRSGHFIGQDFGRISSISETDIEVTESVQESSGAWMQRTIRLSLQE